MTTSVTLLGATGSIGRQTADIVAAHPDKFSVVAVTAHRSSQKLAEVALRTKAGFAAIADESAYRGLQKALSGTSIECAAGDQAVIEAASRQADKVVAGISGTAGLAPTLAAVASGADILLANKEALVVAGEWFRREVGKSKARLLPVDLRTQRAVSPVGENTAKASGKACPYGERWAISGLFSRRIRKRYARTGLKAPHLVNGTQKRH